MQLQNVSVRLHVDVYHIYFKLSCGGILRENFLVECNENSKRIRTITAIIRKCGTVKFKAAVLQILTRSLFHRVGRSIKTSQSLQSIAKDVFIDFAER